MKRPGLVRCIAGCPAISPFKPRADAIDRAGISVAGYGDIVVVFMGAVRPSKFRAAVMDKGARLSAKPARFCALTPLGPVPGTIDGTRLRAAFTFIRRHVHVEKA